MGAQSQAESQMRQQPQRRALAVTRPPLSTPSRKGRSSHPTSSSSVRPPCTTPFSSDKPPCTTPSSLGRPPCTTPSSSSAWSLPNKAGSSKAVARLAMMDAYTDSLVRQGCPAPSSREGQAVSVSPQVLAPFKPPQRSGGGDSVEHDKCQSNSQEIEEYAMEVMDLLNV